MPAVEKVETQSMLVLDWNLADLPSSQHRAGLAGLVLVMRWMARKKAIRGKCTLARIDSRGATLELDEEGLKSLFDEVYAASSEEVDRAQPMKNTKTKKEIPYLRSVERSFTDKNGKEKTKTVYVYPQVVPAGSFLADLDAPASGGKGFWIKLWRDVVWGVLRGVPATRRPFEARAAKEDAGDAAVAWSELTRADNPALDLPSTYFVGAQATTAEAVSFTDRARQRFLLHFWPFATPIYVPQVVDNEGERNFVGFALAFPDVRDLDGFCLEYRRVLEERGHETNGYRPRDAVVDLAAEGALDLTRRLAERLVPLEGRKPTADLLLGIDVIHLEREGNNVRVRSSARVEPDLVMCDEYARIRSGYWNVRFRRQRLLNLLAKRRWFAGFERLAATVPVEQLIGDQYFRHDAREAFKEANVRDEVNADEPMTSEGLVYRVVGTYIASKVKSKTDLSWGDVKANPSKEKDYNEAREKVAKTAFLAVRSRSGGDFVAYFSGTLCSVPHHVGEEGFLVLTRALLADPETIRTLTLLALSARG